MAFVTLPPDGHVAVGGHLIRREITIFGRMPLGRNQRLHRLEIVLTGEKAAETLGVTLRAANTLVAVKHRCTPFMTMLTLPPDSHIAVGGYLIRR